MSMQGCQCHGMHVQYEWWGEGVSYCQVLWISHTSLAFGFDHISSVLSGHYLSITCVCFLFSPAIPATVSLCICCCLFVSITSCLHILLLRLPLSLALCPVTQCHYICPAGCCLSVNTLFLVNLSHQLAGTRCMSWQWAVIAACLVAYSSVTDQHPVSVSAQMRMWWLPVSAHEWRHKPRSLSWCSCTQTQICTGPNAYSYIFKCGWQARTVEDVIHNALPLLCLFLQSALQ